MNWQHILYHVVNGLSAVIVSYFFLANGTYTVLLLLSLSCVWVHVRRFAYQGLDEIRDSAVTPPATIIMPAWNEQSVIVDSVRSALKTEYPGLEVLVVDDGSSDETLTRLIEAFHLVKLDLIYRSRLPTHAVRGFYVNSEIPNLMVISKENGGKYDALNVGLSACRTPYFCTLDADCILERDALLRLMRPIVRSPENLVASGGIVRILNGCEVRDGRVIGIGLPQSVIGRFQVVEYLRTFLLGRIGWDALGGTLIISGAFAMFHLQSVIEAGGFAQDTVTEDMDLVVQLYRWSVRENLKIKMVFTSDPVCWTECPGSLADLGRQRRRWQLGLCQTLWKHSEVLFNRKYGVIGLFSYPFHLYVEALGAVVELLGYVLVPIAFLSGIVSPRLFLLFICLALVYGAFLSVGAVLLGDLTYRRYPKPRDLMVLMMHAILENFGYRQVILFYRVQGIVRFLTGFREWEKVIHVGSKD